MKILKEGLAFSIAEIFGVKNIELKDSLRVQSILQEYADKKESQILDYHCIGDKEVYGLKVSDGVIVPTNAAHTRFYFASDLQRKIIIHLAESLTKYGAEVSGRNTKKAIRKINQCDRIMNYYRPLSMLKNYLTNPKEN